MEREAVSAGLYETGGMKVPRLQILTAAKFSTTGGYKYPLDLRKASKRRDAKKRAKIGCFDCLIQTVPLTALSDLNSIESAKSRGEADHAKTGTRLERL